jgi:hypothetical protein
MSERKNDLKPKPYAKTNPEKWGYLTGYELEGGLSADTYTRDQIRALASKYGVPRYSSEKNMHTLVEVIKKTKGYIEANPNPKQSSRENNYKTIFEIIRDKSKGSARPFSWYKNTIKTLSNSFSREPTKLILSEKRDALDDLIYQDRNINRKFVYTGHLYFFDYRAETKELPYYDKFPLVYVLKVENDCFYGANLHYVEPKKRLKIILNLEHDKIDIPKKIIHKYLKTRCGEYYLDLAKQEWQSAILLPVEDFVLMRGNGSISYDKELVWEEMKQYYSNRLLGTRIVRGKNKKDIERVD